MDKFSCRMKTRSLLRKFCKMWAPTGLQICYSWKSLALQQFELHLKCQLIMKNFYLCAVKKPYNYFTNGKMSEKKTILWQILLEQKNVDVFHGECPCLVHSVRQQSLLSSTFSSWLVSAALPSACSWRLSMHPDFFLCFGWEFQTHNWHPQVTKGEERLLVSSEDKEIGFPSSHFPTPV